MLQGVIDGFSEIVEWKIPHFFPVQVESDKYLKSPSFSLAGCTWHLIVYPNSGLFNGYVSAYLYIDDPEAGPKSVTYILGLKKARGLVEEVAIRRGKLWGSPVAFWKLDDLYRRSSELVPFGAFTITCRIECVKQTSGGVAPKPSELSPHRMILVELEKLSSDFGDLLSDDRKYDVTIDVQGKEFRAHRSVLSARSPVFRAMYEHDTAEAKTGLLTIPDCNPDSFGHFLRYLYTGRLEEVSFQTAYHLYTTAEKYDAQLLKSFCTGSLELNLTTENICDAVILADQYSDDRLMSSAQDFFNKNSCKIFLTSEWDALLQNTRLASRLLREMATATLKST